MVPCGICFVKAYRLLRNEDNQFGRESVESIAVHHRRNRCIAVDGPQRSTSAEGITAYPDDARRQLHFLYVGVVLQPTGCNDIGTIGSREVDVGEVLVIVREAPVVVVYLTVHHEVCHHIAVRAAHHVVHSRKQTTWLEVIDNQFAAFLVPHICAWLHRIIGSILKIGCDGACMRRHQVIEALVCTENDTVGILPVEKLEPAVPVNIQRLLTAFEHLLVLEGEVTCHSRFALEREHVAVHQFRIARTCWVVRVDGIVLHIGCRHRELQSAVGCHFVALHIFPADEVAVVVVLGCNGNGLTGFETAVVVQREPAGAVGYGLQHHLIIYGGIIIRPVWVWRIDGVVPICLCHHT